MYHIILLDRMLTVYHSLTTNLAPATAPPEITKTLARSLSLQLGWLRAFTTKDGRYADFNDATAGIAPSVSDLTQRAAELRTVGGRNSSDVWGGFRVGRRAVTRLERETENTLTASHNGYGLVHRRTFDLSAKGLEITDVLTRAETGTVRFHFHQHLTPHLTAEGCSVGGLSISWTEGEARLVPYERAVGWNELRPAWCLEVVFRAEVKFHLASNS